MRILQLGDPILEQKAKEVTDIKSSKTQKLIDDMLSTINANIENTAGISAPQIGMSERIVICNRFDIVGDDDKKAHWEVMINPEIIWKNDEEISVHWEGCLSVKEGNLFGEVERPADVKVKYITREGKEKTLTASDFFAHVVQHEVDHLNGILFLKYIKDPTKLYTSRELDKILSEKKSV